MMILCQYIRLLWSYYVLKKIQLNNFESLKKAFVSAFIVLIFLSFHIRSSGQNYCESYFVSYAAGNTDYYSSITNVTFNAIDNTSVSSKLNQTNTRYQDFTAIETPVTKGKVYTLSVSFYNTYFNNTDYVLTGYVTAWFDWNNDGDFSDNGECFDIGNNLGSTIFSCTVTKDITIPSGASTTATRMRITLSSGGYCSNSCETSSNNGGGTTYGEVEDYTLNINEPCTSSVPTVTSNQEICFGESATLNVSGSLETGNGWQWATGLCDGTVVGTNSTITVAPKKTTTYYVKQTGACSGECATTTVTVYDTVPAFSEIITPVVCEDDVTSGAIVVNVPYWCSFDGNQYVSFASQLLNNVDEFTLEGWIYVEEIDLVDQTRKYGLWGQNDVVEFGINYDGQLTVWTKGMGSELITTDIELTDGERHHVAVTGKTNGSVILYLDGDEKAEGSGYTPGTSGDDSNAAGFVFDDENSESFNGDVFKIGFWNKQLTTAQIQNLASELHAYVDDDENDGLIAGYNFFEGSDNTLTSVPSGNNGLVYDNSNTVSTLSWQPEAYDYSWIKEGGDGTVISTSEKLSGIGVGNYTVTVKNGTCERSKTLTVVAVDSIKPVVLCKAASIALGNEGKAAVDTALINNGSTDNCAIDSMWVVPDTVTCSNLGSISVALYVRDVQGNVGSGTTSVTVTAPTASVSITANKTIPWCSGDEIIFTAIPVAGGTNPSYKWFVDDTEVEGETASIFKTTELTTGQEVTCSLTSSLSCVSGDNPVFSDTITADVIDFNIVVTDNSSHLNGDCPETETAFNPANDSYNPGITQLVFVVERTTSTDTWNFDFGLTGSSVDVSNLSISGNNTTLVNSGSNISGTVTGVSNTRVTFSYDIKNILGSSLEVAFTISNGDDGSSCSEKNIVDNKITHNIKSMPTIGNISN